MNAQAKSRKGSCLWGVLLFFILVFLDQATKMVADAYFSQPSAPSTITLIDGWAYLCQHYNDGIAYSWFQNASAWLKIGVIVGTGVLMAIFAVAYFCMDKRRSCLRIAFVLIVAGGVGNLIDRIYFKVWDPNALYGVRDMLDISAFGFGVCNLADVFISFGAVLLVLALVFFDKEAVFPLGKYRKLDKEKEQEKGKDA